MGGLYVLRNNWNFPVAISSVRTAIKGKNRDF